MRNSRAQFFLPISLPVIVILISLCLFYFQSNWTDDRRADDRETAQAAKDLGQAPHHSDRRRIAGKNHVRQKNSSSNTSSTLLAETLDIHDPAERKEAFLQFGDEFAADRKLILYSLRKIDRIDDKADFIQGVLKSLFEHDPTDAATLVDRMEDGGLKDWGHANMATLWLERREPETAAKWCERIHQPMERRKVALAIVEQWAGQDPDSAFTWQDTVMMDLPSGMEQSPMFGPR